MNTVFFRETLWRLEELTWHNNGRGLPMKLLLRHQKLEKTGAAYPTVLEHSLHVQERVGVQWKAIKVDLMELANKR